MQIDGTKLVFVMNCCVLHFFKFTSRMPQIAQILVSTFKIFQLGKGRGGMPLDTPRNFFSILCYQFQALLSDPAALFLPSQLHTGHVHTKHAGPIQYIKYT